MAIKNTKKPKKGFTLTEVLVVVLIIGVISAIAYPVYTKSINKSRAVEAINLLEMVRNKQIANFARRGEYLPDFTNIGQLTNNAEAEVKSNGNAILTVNDNYRLFINPANHCISASYMGGKARAAVFTFSASYEEAGLGCDGDICSSFGDVVGSASAVCSCGDKNCDAPYVLNPQTCACDCPLACTEGGCRPKNPARTETQSCGYKNTGTQTRNCPESCGECTENWGPCSGQNCNEDTKPASTQACSNCGARTQSVTCENGSWKQSGFGACSGTKTETAPCGDGYTGNKTRICSNDIWRDWDLSGCERGLTKEDCAERGMVLQGAACSGCSTTMNVSRTGNPITIAYQTSWYRSLDGENCIWACKSVQTGQWQPMPYDYNLTANQECPVTSAPEAPCIVSGDRECCYTYRGNNYAYPWTGSQVNVPASDTCGDLKQICVPDSCSSGAGEAVSPPTP